MKASGMALMRKEWTTLASAAKEVEVKVVDTLVVFLLL
jgi:hypothetical protein